MAKNPFSENKYEIMYKIINSVLSGVIFLMGAFSDGDVSSNGIMWAIIVCCLTATLQFQQYWTTQEQEYKSTKLFNFIP